jgi:hypothetical protein
MDPQFASILEKGHITVDVNRTHRSTNVLYVYPRRPVGFYYPVR